MVHFLECSEAKSLEHCLLFADCPLHRKQPAFHITAFADSELLLQLIDAVLVVFDRVVRRSVFCSCAGVPAFADGLVDLGRCF